MIESYLTPYKLNKPILSPSGTPGRFDECAVDAPHLFWHNNRYYLMYVGFDGKGYQTALATSTNLIDWTFEGLILRRGEPGRWDSVGAAGSSILRESYGLDDRPRLKKHQGKYWMIYHAYPADGYEAGPAEMGLAWCEDENLLDWHRLDQPVLSWRNGGEWEKGGLYKAWLMEHDGLFYLFYNAKDKDEPGWVEQTGMATSTDLMHWQRCERNPVLQVSAGRWDSKFVSDPIVLQDRDNWVMFYFGFDGRHAQEGIAFSHDLIHWEKHREPILTVGTGSELDTIHAHKPAVVRHNGALYHIYCAVRPWQPGDAANNGGEFRCLTVACSKPLPQ